MRNVHLLKFMVALLIGFTTVQTHALATLFGDANNGEKVHTARCMACHQGMFGGDGSKIFTREDHQIKTIEGLMQRVEVCNTNTQNGELNAEQLDDITSYLNETYYKFED